MPEWSEIEFLLKPGGSLALENPSLTTLWSRSSFPSAKIYLENSKMPYYHVAWATFTSGVLQNVREKLRKTTLSYRSFLKLFWFEYTRIFEFEYTVKLNPRFAVLKIFMISTES